MAEIAINVRNQSAAFDGQIVDVFTDDRIAFTHAEMICLNSLKLRNHQSCMWIGSPLYDMLRVTMQYQFYILGREKLLRIELLTGEAEEFGPDDIDITQYLVRRLRHKRNRIFSDGGSRITYFGGAIDYSSGAVNAAWCDIERLTGFRRECSRFQLWPAGRRDLREFLFLRVPEANRDIQGSWIDWRAVCRSLGVSTTDVLNRRCRVDCRNKIISHRSISGRELVYG